MNRNHILVFLVLINFVASAQKSKKEDQQLLSSIKAHINFLASDKLEGRRTGTEGERIAAEYISNQFKTSGLLPKGTSDYFQSFEIAEGRQVNTASHLLIDGHALKLNNDFFPLSYSANESLEAMPSMALQEPQMPWFIDVKEVMEENSSNPHFDVAEAIKVKVTGMATKGASAVFVYNTGDKADDLAFNGKEMISALNIPVVYITKSAALKYINDPTASYDIKLKIDIGQKKRTGKNVVGYIDNGAVTTIVLGAHFDHLGWGEDGNSMMRTGEKQLHNGADDNASGTAALIEIGRALKVSKNKQNNYLLIAFSGEELGLYGSKYFVENPTVDLSKVNYMINMDMLGRLNDSSRIMTVGGYGTSPAWGELYNAKSKQGLYKGNLNFKYDSSGTGPSDHTSFYRKSIPVLFFFTGLHVDYHKPSDDFDKINYEGEVQIVKHILSLIENSGKKGSKFLFTKTRETQMNTNTRFSVTLGVMPDYTYVGAGLRIDGVSENKPAQKAGMKAGDIITAIGDHKVGSIESYMQALNKFKKGDKTTVQYKRGTENLSSAIAF